MNVITIIGNMTRDPELTMTPNGTPVCKFSVAVNDGYGDKKKVFFFNCVAWKGTGETIAKYNTKGSKIGITGKLTQRTWEGQDGRKNVSVEILVNDFTLLGDANRSNRDESDAPPAKQSKPAAAPPAKKNSFDDDDEPNAFDDSDIPF